MLGSGPSKINYRRQPYLREDKLIKKIHVLFKSKVFFKLRVLKKRKTNSL
jgi:hypothetical protein